MTLEDKKTRLIEEMIRLSSLREQMKISKSSILAQYHDLKSDLEPVHKKQVEDFIANKINLPTDEVV